MHPALELHGVVKRFEAGAGACRAACSVLRGADLTVERGETVAIAAARGAGTSTLLLCAAGLLCANAGDIAWFGERVCTAARTHACYVAAAPSLPRARVLTRRATAGAGARIFLIDAPDGLDRLYTGWIAARRAQGAAIVYAVHDEDAADCVADCVADRTLRLHGGVLHASRPSSARVAERDWRSGSPIR
jgi:alpha-D-ribose 1-methylphosphonate 5-triphosphate synthase subunit PhnL